MSELQCPEYRSPYITNKGGSETTLTLQYLGSNDLRLLVSDRAVYSGCAHDRRAGNRYPLASGRLSLLLALEIASACRQAERNAGNSATDPGDEPRQSALGRPRIHGELLKLGIDVGQTSVAKYM